MRKPIRSANRHLPLIVLTLGVGWIAGPAAGWGPLGHQIIGALADARLTPEARAFVEKRLGGPSLADVANWADTIRSGDPYAGSIWYHFEKIPDGVNYLDNLRSLPFWQQRKGGLVAAILVADASLRDPAASLGEQTDALKFLVHLVGDLHQPLHTGRPEDKGGLDLPVTWFGTPMNLHRVWDSGLLEIGHADIAFPRMRRDQAGATHAEYLERRFSGSSPADEMDVEAWLDETLALRPGAYEEHYKKDQGAYLMEHVGEADRQLYLAGIRLARLLNDIAAGAPPPAREKELWTEIENILGDPRRIIRLHR